MNNRAKWARLRALAAGFALVRVDLHLRVAGRNGIETARVETGLPEAETAAVRDRVVLDRAVVAGGGDDGDDIFRGVVDVGVEPHREPDTPADNLALLIDAAAV